MTTWDLACLIKPLYDQATNKYVANVIFECVDVPLGLFSLCRPFRSSNGDREKVFKFLILLESISRKITLKLGSVPSLRFCHWIATMYKVFKDRKNWALCMDLGDTISELQMYGIWLLRNET